MDANDPQIKAQREQFIKSFQDIAKATANLHAITVKQIELTNRLIDSIDGLAGAIVDPKNGLLVALDELSEDIQELRADLGVRQRRGG